MSKKSFAKFFANRRWLKSCLALVLALCLLAATPAAVGGKAFAAEGYGEEILSFTTNFSVGSPMYLDLGVSADIDQEYEVYVDWGDGEPVPYDPENGEGIVAGSTIRVYTDNDLYNITASGYYDEYSSNYMGCGITSIDLSKCVGLEYLNVSNNFLEELDVTNCPRLEMLYCDFNNIAELDISNNTKLMDLWVSGNPISELAYENLTDMQFLDVSYTGLDSLDVSRMQDLEVLCCNGLGLEELDLSGCPKLAYLAAEDNNLSELDLSANPYMEDVTCNNNAISELILNENSPCEFINASNNLISEIDVSAFSDLEHLYLENNLLTELNLENNSALFGLRVSDNYLTELDISGCPNIESLHCSGNYLEAIDLSNASELFVLVCDRNQITELDVSGLEKLQSLNCGGNRISSLDVSNNADLWLLYADYNKLHELDLSNNDAIRELNLNGNYFTLSTVPPRVNDIFCFYEEQNYMLVTPTLEAGEELDLSSEYMVGGNETVFEWWYSDEGGEWDVAVPETEENGVFTFGDEYIGCDVYGAMYNETYPGMYIYTTNFKVVNDELTVVNNIDPTEKIVIIAASADEEFSAVDSANKPVSVGDLKMIFDRADAAEAQRVMKAAAASDEFVNEDDESIVFNISYENASGAAAEIASGEINVYLKHQIDLPPAMYGYFVSLLQYSENGQIDVVYASFGQSDEFSQFMVSGEGTFALVYSPCPELDFDVTPKVTGAASKLYEPWGLKYYATYNGEDSDLVSNFGMVMLKDTYYDESMTALDMAANPYAEWFSSDTYSVVYEEPTDKYPNGRYSGLLDYGIYSYDIGAKYYVAPYVEMMNGQIIFGKTVSTSMQTILNSNLNSSSVTAAEKSICTCILALKESVAEYYSATGIQGADVAYYPSRGFLQSSAPEVKTAAEAGLTPSIRSAASRLIEPWGIKFIASFTGEADVVDYGIAMLAEDMAYGNAATDGEELRMCTMSYVFTESEGTLVYDRSNYRYSAILTDGVSSRDISKNYYAVPFAVLDDGSYVYGTIRTMSMLKILQANLNSSSVSAAEKAVCQDIIDLHNAVKVYYGDE